MDSSLNGLVVAVTASQRALELGHLAESYGGKAYIAPTLGIKVSDAFGHGATLRKSEVATIRSC